MARRPASLIGIAIILASVAARGASLETGAIDRLIERSMARWEVPAVAVAVVDRGEVVLFRTRGFGDIEGRRAVTPRTLFAIGSITKSFTVVALSQFAAKGRLNWDSPASRYLPELRLQRLNNARRVTVRDLVTHRAGMHRHDALWYLHAHTRTELIRRLRYLDPFAPPGKKFQYSNILVAAAGLVAAQLGHQSWETVAEEGVLTRAGMSDTRLTLAAFLAEPDKAAGYFPGDDGRVRIPQRDTSAIAPAASGYSNIQDMTRWLRVFLNDGMIDGARVVGSEEVAEILRPQITVTDDTRFPELGPVAYGMGFYVTKYRGKRLVRHPGVIDGYAALMSFMPERGLGIVVLTNLSGRNPVPSILSYSIYDRLLDLTPISWIDRFPSAKQIRAKRSFTNRPPTTGGHAPTSLSLKSYAGIYRHPAYGSIEITTSRENGLAGQLHGIRFPLQHVAGDEWEVADVHWPLRKGLRMRFRVTPSGRVRELATPLADGPTYAHNPGDLTFTRLPENRPGPRSGKDSINRIGIEDAKHPQ